MRRRLAMSFFLTAFLSVCVVAEEASLYKPRWRLSATSWQTVTAPCRPPLGGFRQSTPARPPSLSSSTCGTNGLRADGC